MKQRIIRLLTAAAVLAALPLSAALTTSSHRQASYGSYGDIEPTVITQMRSGIEYQTAVWMEFAVQPPGTPVYSQLKFNSFNSGNATGGYLGKASGYLKRYADPLLAQNTSTNRMYLIGLTAGDVHSEPSAIVRWYSDNGGQSWSSPLVVTTSVALASPQPAATVFLDKPAIAVSSASNSSGYVYVAYVRENLGTNGNPNGTNQIVLKVSTNNGTSFSQEIPVSAQSAGHHAPQVMVDNLNGEVYVVWLRDGLNTLHFARLSAYNGSTMTSIQTAQTTIGGTFTGNVAIGGLTVRGLTTPTAKLDNVNRRIAVTWHETQNNVARAVFQTIDLVNGMTQASWRPDRTLLPTKGGHDLQPALAFDTQGNVLVAYYAFGSGSTSYWHVGQYITFNSARAPVLESPSATVDLTPSPSDAIYLYTVNNLTLLGEYHDVSFVNGTFKTVGILAFDYSNVFVYTTQHY
jgi:hypothetical protein